MRAMRSMPSQNGMSRPCARGSLSLPGRSACRLASSSLTGSARRGSRGMVWGLAWSHAASLHLASAGLISTHALEIRQQSRFLAPPVPALPPLNLARALMATILMCAASCTSTLRVLSLTPQCQESHWPTFQGLAMGAGSSRVVM